MKNLMIVTLIILGLGSAQISNAQSRREKRIAATEKRAEKNGVLDKKAKEQNCFMPDDDEYYTASGMMRVKMGGNDMGEKDFTVQKNKLLGSCQQQLQMKFKGSYKAVVRDYFVQMDIDSKSSVASKIESAGEKIIDQVINDTEAVCEEYGDMDEAGYAMLYMGIQMRKSAVIEQIVKGISEDEQLKVRFNEEKFRESAFKVFEQ